MNNYEIMMNGNVKIGEYAPDFEAITTMGNIKFSDYRGKWVVLFSHPGDFTPVCTTEMIAFSKANTYFEKLNTCLIGLSVDSNSSHLAWVYDIYIMRNCFIYLCFCVFYFSFVKKGDGIIPTAQFFINLVPCR